MPTTIIRGDVVWKAGTTHVLSGKIQIAPGASLTVQAGAKIDGRGNEIEVGGSLHVDGTGNKRVEIDDLYINYLPRLDISARIDIANTDFTGGGFLNPGNAGYGSFSLKHCVVDGWQSYTHIWYPDAPVLIEGNIFRNSGGIDVGTKDADIKILNNVFFNPTLNEEWSEAAFGVWARYDDRSILVTGNSFLSTETPALSAMFGFSPADFDAPSNWFGTTRAALINRMVLDGHDDLNRDLIRYGSPLSGPDPLTPFHGTNAAEQYAGDNVQDRLFGEGGNDALSGRGGNDKVWGGDGDDRLSGGGGKDELRGDAGDDVLSGNEGNDLLFGGVGSNRLIGGLGRDLLYASDGADIFDFNTVDESPRGIGRDIIFGFERGEDRIDLRTIDAQSDGAGTNERFSFIGASGFHGIDGELRFRGSILSADTNGDRTADLQIELRGVSTLSVADLLL